MLATANFFVAEFPGLNRISFCVGSLTSLMLLHAGWERNKLDMVYLLLSIKTAGDLQWMARRLKLAMKLGGNSCT